MMPDWWRQYSLAAIFVLLKSTSSVALSPEPAIRFARSSEVDGRLAVGLNRQRADRDGNYGRNSQRRQLTDANVYEAEGGLYPGYGTHFAYVYVGTPPQRVSVIVDTGSHYTAFPCKGCSGCGSHTDPYFDLSQSSTGHELECGECQSTGCSHPHNKCEFSQSYSEGSSWHAYQVIDKFYTGVEVLDETPAANAELTIDFLFGCQSSETGLFRTQLADGIMGMAMNKFSLVDALHTAGAVAHNNFALCFNEGGGVLSLGGADARLHAAPMAFVPLAKNSGWYTVELQEIRVGGAKLEVGATHYNSGKGTIVDSGTTDTYLNSHAASQFREKWHAAAGMAYSNSKKTLTAAQVAALPDVTYVFANGVEVVVRPTSYMEHEGNDHYTARIYLDEPSGQVLGANFMNRHDVFFDEEGQRVGFAESACDMGVIGTGGGAAAEDRDCEVSEEFVLQQACDAVCAPGQAGVEAEGVEVWGRTVLQPQQGAGAPCPEDLTETRPCSVLCRTPAPTAARTAAPTAAPGGCATEEHLVRACNATCSKIWADGDAEEGRTATGYEVWERTAGEGQGADCPAAGTAAATAARPCTLDCESALCSHPEEGLWGHCARTCRQQRVDVVVPPSGGAGAGAGGDGGGGAGGGCQLVQRERACHIAPCALEELADRVKFTLLLAPGEGEGDGAPPGRGRGRGRRGLGGEGTYEDELEQESAALLSWVWTALRAQQLCAAVAAAAGVPPGDVAVEWEGVGARVAPATAAEALGGGEVGEGGSEGDGVDQWWGVPIILHVLPPEEVPAEELGAWGEGGPFPLEAVEATVEGSFFGEAVANRFWAEATLAVAVVVQAGSIEVNGEAVVISGDEDVIITTTHTEDSTDVEVAVSMPGEGNKSEDETKSFAVILSGAFACGLVVIGMILYAVQRTGPRYRPFQDLTRPGDPDYEERPVGEEEEGALGAMANGNEVVSDGEGLELPQRGEYALTSQRSTSEDGGGDDGMDNNNMILVGSLVEEDGV